MERADLNIWVSRRVDGDWSVARPLPAPLNPTLQGWDLRR
jgi:hypothetical protein